MNNKNILYLLTFLLTLILLMWNVIAAENNEQERVSIFKKLVILDKECKFSESVPLAKRYLVVTENEFGSDHPKTIEASNILADIYEKNSDYAKAVPLYERSLSIREKALGKNDPDTTDSIDRLAGVYSDMGDYAKALPLYERSLSIREKALGANHPDTAVSINNLANIYNRMGDYTKALPLYERAFGIYVKTKGIEHADTVAILNNISGVYENMSNYAKAVPLYERTISIRKKVLGENHPDTAASMEGLANTYLALNDYAKALPLYERSLSIREKALGENHPDTALSLNNLAACYDEMGDYAKAISLDERALSIREKALGENHPDTADSMANLATTYEHMGDYAKAISLDERVLVIREKALGTNHPSTADILNAIAACYGGKGDNAKALPLFERSLSIREKALGENHPDTAESLLNLARIHSDQCDYAKALQFYEQALRIYEKVPGSQNRMMAYTFNNMAVVSYLAGDIPRATSCANRSIAFRQNQLPTILTMDEKTRLSWQRENLFFWPACVLEPPLLAQTALRWKGVVFASLMEDRALALQTSGSEDGRQKLLEIQSLRSRLSKLAFVPGKEKESLQIQDQIGQFQRALSKRPSALGRARMGAEMTLNEILPALVGGVTFIDLISFADPKLKGDARNCYGAIILGEDGSPSFVRLNAADEIDRAVSQLRAALDKGDAKAVEAKTQFLSENVWQPIAAKLPAGTKRLTICPDGKLNFLAFAALLNPDNSFAVEKYPISYVASGRDLTRPTVKEIPRTMAIIANPLFDAKATNSKPLQQLAMRSGSADLFGEVILPPLPGTAAEAESLKAVASSAGWDASIMSGADASERQVRSLKKPGIVHLATHGFFLNSAAPPPSTGERGMSVKGIETEHSDGNAKGVDPMMASGVALSGAQETLTAWSQQKAPDPSNDGILTAEEVAGLNLDGTWLVTLSACETGVGESRSGEGVFGLRRAFMMAGAQNLLMTLWPVSDEVTPKIMADFYKKALATGDAAGSLSDVQRDWLVKLRQEKGILAAVRDAGPFAMVVMANPNVKQSLVAENPPIPKNTPSIDSAVSSPSDAVSTSPVRGNPAIMEFNDAQTRADGGDAYAQAVVSIYYRTGYKTEKDLVKAAAYAKSSAKQNNPLGIFQLGSMRQNGEGGIEKNHSQGVALRKAALKGLCAMPGDPYALMDLASVSLLGEEVKKDAEAAARLFKKSADQGYAPAQVIYGSMLANGIGVEQNPEQGTQYIQKAAQQNYSVDQ